MRSQFYPQLLLPLPTHSVSQQDLRGPQLSSRTLDTNMTAGQSYQSFKRRHQSLTYALLLESLMISAHYKKYLQWLVGVPIKIS